ncbi:MAG TPA: zinc ribbon domain-containing protein [Ktedonobacteraceae bacterium]|nr:zinc ribbon domain-containing protein [Ktedonobacteraceae bacterium]
MQSAEKVCKQCGAALAANQSFCAQCGAPADMTQREALTAPPPPPPPTDEQTFIKQPFDNPYTSSGPGSAETYPPASAYQSPWQAYPPPPPLSTIAPSSPPSSALPVPPPRRRRSRRWAYALVLLFVVLSGGLAYGGYMLATRSANHTSGSQNTPVVSQTSPAGNSHASATSSGSGSTSSSPVTVNAALNFGTIDLTILTVQQAGSFPDDHNTTGEKIVRVNFKEANNTRSSATYGYGDVARLITGDASSIAPGNSKYNVPPVAGATQDNWLDFPVPANTEINNLILRLGSQSQAQMDIPLQEKADLSQYQARSATFNLSVKHGRATWTLTKATLSWSAARKQAATGMRYVVLEMQVAASENINYGLPWSVRLKAGDSTVTADPDGSSIPESLPAGASTKAIAAFQVPEGLTAFTFLLLSDAETPEAHIDFQI